ncbi:MAG: hypothetical protein H3C27_08545 [Opitutaceae bacterium]|nr:hypothetical protein [Opitutaceae bacterium]
MTARENAASAVRAQLGLPASPLAWTYEQRLAYINALADYILANPAGFDAQDLGQASAVKNTQYSGLVDTSFDWSMFGTELTANAEKLSTGFAEKFSMIAAIALVVWLAIVAFRTRPAK